MSQTRCTIARWSPQPTSRHGSPGTGPAGPIEAHTADIARDIASQGYSLYVFEGLLMAGSFATLHLSSHLFEEPGCLELLKVCDRFVSVHGCGHPGEVMLISGRDLLLRGAIAERVRAVGLVCGDAPPRARCSGPEQRLQSRTDGTGRAAGGVPGTSAIAATGGPGRQYGKS